MAPYLRADAFYVVLEKERLTFSAVDNLRVELQLDDALF